MTHKTQLQLLKKAVRGLLEALPVARNHHLEQQIGAVRTVMAGGGNNDARVYERKRKKKA